ncbi:hypothetical protein [Serratia sp. 2723]|uniref:hypothetical protein n=1 Tax=unclassified Serratia (in: enterobacteria) TaxID=2647522 RepID=UPI003D22FCBA
MDDLTIFNLISTLVIILIGSYFTKKVIKNSKLHEEWLAVNGIKATATILSMRQSGMFINYNPVLDLKLRITKQDDECSYIVEAYKETALLIALDSYKVGATYKIRIGKNENDIQFERDDSGRPISIGAK